MGLLERSLWPDNRKRKSLHLYSLCELSRQSINSRFGALYGDKCVVAQRAHEQMARALSKSLARCRWPVELNS
jgi:hypothetical protein